MIIGVLLLIMGVSAAAQVTLIESEPTDGPYYFNEWKARDSSSFDFSYPRNSALSSLKAAGFTDDDLKAWAPFVLSKYSFMEINIPSGSPLDSTYTVTRSKELWIDVNELIAWKNTGIGPTKASFYQKNYSLGPHDASLVDPTIQSKCNGKLEPNIKAVNPYTTKGKCYLLLNLTVLQVLNAHSVLVNPPILVTYRHEDIPAEGQKVWVLVKSIGAFVYNTAGGYQATVPNVTVLYNASAH